MSTTNLVDELLARRSLPAPPARRAIRLAAGASQGDVARELNVTPETVSRWEVGTREPRGELRARYALLLIALHDVALGRAVATRDESAVLPAPSSIDHSALTEPEGHDGRYT